MAMGAADREQQGRRAQAGAAHGRGGVCGRLAAREMAHTGRGRRAGEAVTAPTRNTTVAATAYTACNPAFGPVCFGPASSLRHCVCVCGCRAPGSGRSCSAGMGWTCNQPQSRKFAQLQLHCSREACSTATAKHNGMRCVGCDGPCRQSVLLVEARSQFRLCAVQQLPTSTGRRQPLAIDGHGYTDG